jgi:predicted nuclease with TOPRIM domain
MARKSDGEKIDELVVQAATLNERLDNVREELKELKRQLEESNRRLWLLVPPIVAALLSAGLTAVVNYFVPRH